jgi:hypothetical protein
MILTFAGYFLLVMALAFVWIEVAGSNTATATFRYVGF